MCEQPNQDKKEEYLKQLILVYFKEYGENYDILDLGSKIGITITTLSDYIYELIENNFLRYEDDLLQLTLKGRIYLSNTLMEDYTFKSDISLLYEHNKWDINKIYCVHEFSKKKWRGK